MSSLTAEAITKEYSVGEGRVGVLRDVSWAFEPGKITAIQGASGAGKTTLLHILAGLQKPDGGRVILDGDDLYASNRAALATLRNRRFGFVFQSYQLLPELTALENVLLPTLIGGNPDTARAKLLLERMGLGPRMAHLPSQLSGGEQQRTAIARALAHGPDILFADEPTGNLDTHTGHGVLDLIGEFHKEQGLTVILVTHDARVAERGHTHLLIEDGAIAPQRQSP